MGGKSEAVRLLVGICGKTTVVCLKYAVHNIDKSVIENKVKLCCENRYVIHNCDTNI